MCKSEMMCCVYFYEIVTLDCYHYYKGMINVVLFWGYYTKAYQHNITYSFYLKSNKNREMSGLRSNNSLAGLLPDCLAEWLAAM